MPLTGDAKREYQRKWTAARRAAYFEGKSCAECGSTDRLELDHIDPALKVSHRIWNWSKARQKVELAKCQPLCYDCHKVKSSKDISNMFTTTHCENGHDWNLVEGFYSGDFNHRYCKYCRHVWDATRRNGKIKSFDTWLSNR